MAKRNKQEFKVIWLHMSTGHPSYDAAIIAMRAQHESQGPFKLSINLNDAGTESLVKVAGKLPAWPVGQPWAAAAKRIFTEADHDEALALVTDPLWEKPPA